MKSLEIGLIGANMGKWVITENIRDKKNSKLGVKRSSDISVEAGNLLNMTNSTSGV